MTQKRRKPEGYDDMTHDELLAEIGDNSERTNNALRAIIKLHKPVLDTFLYGLELDPPEVTERYECDECSKFYPCPTIQAIEKELA